MKINEFIKYIGLYGANLADWPEILRAEAGKLLASSKPAAEALEQEAEFEAMAKLRSSLPEDKNFCDRVVAAALNQKPRLGFKARFDLVFLELGKALPIPHPRVAFSIMLLAGFVYGLSAEAGMAMASKDVISGLLYERQEVL